MKRRPSKELRDLLLEAGLRVLYRTGLRATASHVPMTAATSELMSTHGIRVEMGSIFGRSRLWASVAEYQLDLLRAAIEDETGSGPNEVSRELIEHLPDHTHLPFAERIAIMVSLCRSAGWMNGYISPSDTAHRSWDLWIGIWATAVTAADAGEVLRPALAAEVERSAAAFDGVYESMLTKLGLRMRSPYTVRQMTHLAASLTDGVALRSALMSEFNSPIRSRHDDESWNLLGLGLSAIVLEMLEDALPAPTGRKRRS